MRLYSNQRKKNCQSKAGGDPALKRDFALLNKLLPYNCFMFLSATGEKIDPAFDKLRQFFGLVCADSIYLAVLHIELEGLGAGNVIKPAIRYLSYAPSIIPGVLFYAEIFNILVIELFSDQSYPEFYFQMIHISGDS